MDASVFWPTLLATLAGALVGVFGVWLVFRLESRARYRTRLDDALGRIIVELAQRNTDLDNFFRPVVRPGSPPVGTAPPSDLPLLAAMEVALMISRKEDFSILNHLVHRVYTAIQGSDLRLHPGANGLIIGAIERWRSGQWPTEQVVSTLDTAADFASRLGKSERD